MKMNVAKLINPIVFVEKVYKCN